MKTLVHKTEDKAYYLEGCEYPDAPYQYSEVFGEIYHSHAARYGSAIYNNVHKLVSDFDKHDLGITEDDHEAMHHFNDSEMLEWLRRNNTDGFVFEELNERRYYHFIGIASQKDVEKEFNGDMAKASQIMKSQLKTLMEYSRGNVYELVVYKICGCCENEERVASSYEYYGWEEKLETWEYWKDNLDNLREF